MQSEWLPPWGEAQRVEKPPSAREVPRRGGGREPCHSPKYFGQPYSSLPHRLRAEPPRRGGQGVSTPFSTVCGFPLGGSCQRPRPLTDEGQPCHYYPFTACRGKLSPHPALRGHLPPKGKALGALLLLRPAVAAPHRLIPALQPSGALIVGDARHKLTVHRPVLQHVLGAAPIADGQPGQIRRA